MPFLAPTTIFKHKLLTFWRLRRARYSLVLITIAFMVCLPAEFIANSRPLIVVYEGSWYFPVLKNYRGSDFNFNDDSILIPDYKTIAPTITQKGWMLSPPIWWGYNETNTQPASYPSPPSWDNPLGTDDRGRDVFVRLLYGFRLSILVGLCTLLISALLGTLIGGLQGFLGGRIDLLGQRFVEIWVGMPPLLIIILLAHLFEPSISVLMLCLASFLWTSPQYHIRGECLKVKNMDYVKAARSFGASSWNIFRHHILPNSLTPIITLAPFVINSSILSLSFLDYLGLGVQAPSASLGELLRQGKKYILHSWWLTVYPLITLCSTLLLFNFIGDGLREAFDPRAQHR